ncbi:5-carboxymethyl-2-hydroxymuconate Delta-isomerase [Kocuria palustris]|uniref:5-carboxymethyl-2-hydroxymuconate Delta-isomerase n=1 Tax=Kocuria palustris TaxID=71999 RepID=UPI0011A6375E|nr:hypothetical protein [Kocuria palustris]
MPHLIIETTVDIAALPGFAAQELIRAGMGALKELGEFDMTAAKARARVLEDYAVDHPHDGTGYVAVQLRILPGRSEELRARTSEAILEAVAGAVPQGAAGTVSVEIVEMVRETYVKKRLG